MEKSELINKLAISLNPRDILHRIELEVKIEEMFDDVREAGILNTELFVDFTLLKIPFLEYLMKLKNISSDEARALIAYEYVTYDDFIRILIFGVS